MLRVCSVCCAEKPINKFYADASKRGGYRNDCKSCCIRRTTNYAKHYKNTEHGREKVNQLKKEWAKRARQELRDYYVRKKLTDGTGIKPCDIPREMVEAKRIYMQMNKLLKGTEQ